MLSTPQLVSNRSKDNVNCNFCDNFRFIYYH
jgi:hypothetical protein